jgi:hypothetical protein
LTWGDHPRTSVEHTQNAGRLSNAYLQQGRVGSAHAAFSVDRSGNGKGDAFFEMMTDFVKQYQNKAASTDDFRLIANDHFAKSPIGQRYHLDNLDWFFRQWVYRTELPSYQMEYQVQEQPDGKFLLSGTVKQDDVPEDWFMPLPILISFGGKQQAATTVHALGPAQTFKSNCPRAQQRLNSIPITGSCRQRRRPRETNGTGSTADLP